MKGHEAGVPWRMRLLPGLLVQLEDSGGICQGPEVVQQKGGMAEIPVWPVR